MNKYFNVNIEFDRNIAEHIIESAISDNCKGYVCAIESNNLTIANKNNDFNRILNSSIVNICDGSNVAWLLSKIHNSVFSSYIGRDIFVRFISKCKYRQYFLGNTQDVLASLKSNLIQIDPHISDMCFVSLPFCNVEEFDYKSIAEAINADNSDVIWVSLGAPKQEQFMAYLLPHLNRGVMFGIGAAFNFCSSVGPVKRAPNWMLKIRLEWLYRAFEEPKKNIPRYSNFIKLLPKLVWNEYKRSKQ